MSEKISKRGQWSSSIGFILAAAGSAVGLGNLWKFPYLAGKNGGGAFVFVYLGFIILIGFSIMLAEMAIGRAGQTDAVGSFGKFNKNWKFLGYLGVATSFLIVSYYSVIGGWVLKYIVGFLTNNIGSDTGAYFVNYIGSTGEPIIYHLLFSLATGAIVYKGIAKGIEKASKVMMPALFILLIGVCIRSVTLPGAMEGIKFFLTPDFSKLTGAVVLDALGQVFFSLSLAMGITVTYSSYLPKDENLLDNAVKVPIIDTIVALLSGFAILPAVFALGFEPGAGPGLIFVTLPAVFQNMAFGGLVGIAFFILVFFAALTSSISLLEVSVSLFVDKFKMEREKAVITLVILMFALGIPSSLSTGILGNVKIFFGFTFFDFLDYLTNNIFLPVSGLLTCIYVGYVWGEDLVKSEVTNGGKLTFKFFKLWYTLLKYVAPVVLVLVLLRSVKVI